MARKTASTAAAPSPTAKEKVGATKPASTAAKPVAAPKPPAEVKPPVVPVVPVTETPDPAAASNGAALPGVVAAAVLALASAEDKGPGDEPEAVVPADIEPFTFSLPVVTEFPVVLTITNASPGRHDVAGTNETLAPGETRDVEFTEKGFARFAKQTTQLADLHGWKEGQGVLIEQGEQDAED